MYTTYQITSTLQGVAALGAGMVSGASTVTTNKGIPVFNTNTPSNFIPRDSSGKPIPLAQQNFRGQDIPKPLPEADGRNHTVLGGKISSQTGILYRQSATFSGNTNPKDAGLVPLSRVDWTTHGRGDHANPHQHAFKWDWINNRWYTGPNIPFSPRR